MANNNKIKTRVLKSIIPPLSEMEFVFFVSLFMSTLGLRLFGHSQSIFEYFSNRANLVDTLIFFGSVAFIFFILSPLIRLSIKAVLTNKKPSINDRSQMVILPATFILIIWLLGAFSNTGNTSSSVVATALSTLVTIRYFGSILLFQLYGDSAEFQELAGRQFVHYEMSRQQSLGVVGLGFGLGVLLLFINGWMTWLIIFNAIGYEVLRNVRSRSLSKS